MTTFDWFHTEKSDRHMTLDEFHFRPRRGVISTSWASAFIASPFCLSYIWGFLVFSIRILIISSINKDDHMMTSRHVTSRRDHCIMAIVPLVCFWCLFLPTVHPTTLASILKVARPVYSWISGRICTKSPTHFHQLHWDCCHCYQRGIPNFLHCSRKSLISWSLGTAVRALVFQT